MSDDAAKKKFKEFEEEGWGAQARTYGSFSGAVTSRFAEPLLDAAGVRHDQRVLDVATGPGVVAALAAARGARPTGIDIAEQMLEVARESHPELEFLRADAEELPFEDGAFAAVVGGFVLLHLPDPERALAETRRVLADDGGCAFSVWDTLDRMRLMGVVSDAFDAVEFEDTGAVPPGPSADRFADDDEFTSVLEGAGFRDVAVETVVMSHKVANADELWQGFMGGSVRAAAVARSLPPETIASIREALAELLEAYRAPGGFELPLSAKIGSGRVR
jgi:ubiquinone/menaquinone biosynthesis C-methylase UbiE